MGNIYNLCPKEETIENVSIKDKNSRGNPVNNLIIEFINPKVYSLIK